jgi:molybdopterin-dependent oxidoreductase alpha subunit
MLNLDDTVQEAPMATKDEPTVSAYRHPAGGWGAVGGTMAAFRRQGIPFKLAGSLRAVNKPGGFDCPGCAFPDKNHGSGIDSCEQGQKAIAWEMTRWQADPDFFAAHTLAELRAWSDHDLENAGRLTRPLRYDAASDRYRPISWDDAWQIAAAELRGLPPGAAAFYTSGRASNEAAFLWQLLARAHGSSNLPDSSNLCHEPSGYAMKEVLGVGKGTCTLEDFGHAELIVVIGQNPASNHPRMMVALHDAAVRGARVIALNPLAELGFRNFSDPKNLGEMLGGRGRRVAERVYQVRIGGDLAAIKGVMKRILELDAAALERGQTGLLDHDFIVAHTLGFEALQADLAGQDWETILDESGLTRAELEKIADFYLASNATMCTWCMGITHHEHAVATIQTIVDLLLLKGNIGKPGAGAMPVRGHSNVQGNRTVGATGRVPPRFLDNLESAFGVTLQREPGRDARRTAEGLLDGSIRAFLALGGNFAVAAPDSPRLQRALSSCELTVHVATKLNRSHLHPGRVGLLLPALGRSDVDRRGGGVQVITVEDSTSMTHASQGIQSPLSPEMCGEPALVCGLGRALLGDAMGWREMAEDYGLIRDKMEACLDGVFDGFDGYNQKIHKAGGFHLRNAAAERRWMTPTGKAQFRVHPIPQEGPVHRARRIAGGQVLTLMTLRAHDQFNTTVYSPDDRYRGVFGGRRVIFMNPDDMADRGLGDGERVDVETVAEDGIERKLEGFRLVAYAIPRGCAAAYFPEATPLVPLSLASHHTATPVYKEVPVLVRRTGT